MKRFLGAAIILLGAATSPAAITATARDVSQAHITNERVLQTAYDAPIVGIATGSMRASGASPTTGKDLSMEGEVEKELVAALELDDQVTGEYFFVCYWGEFLLYSCRPCGYDYIKLYEVVYTPCRCGET